MDLNALLQHESEFIRNQTKEVKALATYVERGELDTDEYRELVDDLTDLTRIVEVAKSIEQQANVERALRALKEIAPKLITVL